MTVDIVIQETIDLVDITVNPNIIEVNVTRTSGGGGGNQTLAQTLVLGNTTGGENILINDADAIELENTSLLKKGSYDFGGDGGISRICSNQYEDMWQSGFRHVFDQSGFIRHSTNCFDVVPDSSFDNTLRFKVDSLWTLDNGTTYKCTDASTGAAVWEIYSVGGIPTLQQVTEAGATTDNTIYVSDGVGNEISIQIGQVQILDEFGSYSQMGATGVGFVNGDGTGIEQCGVSIGASFGTQQTGLFLTAQESGNVATLELKLAPEYYTDLPIENIGSSYFIPFKPSGDYTLATLDDIGGGAVDSVNGQTGVVVLDATDVGAPSGSGTSTGTNTGDQDLSGLVAKSAYTPAHSILVQQSGTGSPTSLQISNNTLVGRLSGGGSDINDLSVSDVKGLLDFTTPTDVQTIANAKVSDAIVDGVTTVAPSQNAVFDALQFTRKLITNGTGSVTGTTSETILTSLTIPANTLDSKCFIWSTMDYFKTNAGSCTLRLYVNSANSLSGATLIGFLTLGSNRNASFNRKLYLNGTTLDFLVSSASNSQINNEFIEALFGASTTLTVDPTANIFLIYTTQNDVVGTVATSKQATVQKMKLN
jgi:hypothetical protein